MNRHYKLLEKIATFEKLATMSPEEAASLLGVSPDASVEEINKSHKRMVFQFHPDRNPSPEAASKMVAINVARDVLTNPTAHIRQEGPAARPEVQQEIEDILDREQRKADEWLADIRKRREWSDYLGMQIPFEELTHPENIENAKSVEAKRLKLRQKTEEAKRRKQEKKKDISKAVDPRSGDTAKWSLMIRAMHEVVSKLDPMYQMQDHKERQYYLRQLHELVKAAIEENI
jgi:DnaJ domain